MGRSRYSWCGSILAFAIVQQRGWRWIRLPGLRDNTNARRHVAWLLADLARWVLAHITVCSHLARVFANVPLPRRGYGRYLSNVLAYLASVLSHLASILASIPCVLAYLAELLACLAGIRWCSSRWPSILACFASVLAHESNGWHDVSAIQSRQSRIQSHQSEIQSSQSGIQPDFSGLLAHFTRTLPGYFTKVLAYKSAI